MSVVEETAGVGKNCFQGELSLALSRCFVSLRENYVLTLFEENFVSVFLLILCNRLYAYSPQGPSFDNQPRGLLYILPFFFACIV